MTVLNAVGNVVKRIPSNTAGRSENNLVICVKGQNWSLSFNPKFYHRAIYKERILSWTGKSNKHQGMTGEIF